MKPLFIESQRFTQWWLWVIIIGCGIPFVFGLVQQVLLKGEAFGDKPMSNTGLIIATVLYIGSAILFYFMRLNTNITEQSLMFSFFPFVRKKIDFNEIESLKVINYGFVGGWGIRLFTEYGTVYNIKGNKGVYIKLINGKTLLIGTQKPEELEKTVKNLPFYQIH